ncbi:hypothetical protein [Streptomyces meridianus]|uniref:Holin n=1 Tax=Streptomyces meridianus TaxID=2938945 RepID=A0ABT0XD63_9ACTN|nr:hypothetical protein [Streptomyces meridianus]MCM2580465.1 hypothetical protein [Streptomyces meridianus]
MRKLNRRRVAVNALAFAVTAQLAWSAWRHDMSVLDTATIALLAHYGFTAALARLLDRRTATTPEGN